MNSASDRLLAFLEIILVSGLMTQALAAGTLAAWNAVGDETLTSVRGIFLLTSIDAVLLLGIIALLQWRRGGWVRPFGLRPASCRTEVFWGVFLGIALFALLGLGSDWFFRTFLPELHTPENPILRLLKTPADLAWLLGAGIVGGALREEFQRAFIIQRLEIIWRRAKRHAAPEMLPRDEACPESPRAVRALPAGVWVGLILWSVVFGLGHWVQGPDAVLATVVAGFLLGCVYLWRRSVIAPAVCHGFTNSLAIVITFYFPGLNT